MRNLIHRLLVGGSALALTVGMALAASPSASAYGAANWQLTFAGTGVFPTTGIGFGFWGWCDLAGGQTFNTAGQAISGNSGDCQFSEYFHSSPGSGLPSGTCGISFNLLPEDGFPAWTQAQSSIIPFTDWFISGTQVDQPPHLVSFCRQLVGVPSTQTFSNFDSLLPVIVGHTNLSGLFGTTELQITETPLSP